jgi:flagellar basal-body rod protein FlgB
MLILVQVGMMHAILWGMFEGVGYGNYAAAQKLLDITMHEHKACVTNLAHLETPGWQRVKVKESVKTDFSGLLDRGDLQKLSMLEPMLEEDTTARAIRPDGNTVSMEEELLNMKHNALRYEFLSDYLTDSLKRVQTAITGKHF